MALIPLVFEEKVARDLYFPLERRKEIAQRALDVDVEHKHVEFTPKRGDG